MAALLLLLLILHAWLLSAAAVTFATVLVGDGMLLASVQAWLRGWHRRQWIRRHFDELPITFTGDEYYAGNDLDSQWWWKPLWKCSECVSGQWAFWGYLLSQWHQYHPLHHLYFTSLTILFAAGWRAAYAKCQSL